MPPEPTLWELDPATIGKHLILEHYLDQWLPKMMQKFPEVVFLDAFAGPGEYSGGEPGSPMIALTVFKKHPRLHQVAGNIHFRFVEEREDRAKHLKRTVAERMPEIPGNATHEVVTSTFEKAMASIRSKYGQNGIFPPTLAMIDPFGYSDVTMDLLSEILRNPSSEVYLTFMDPFMERFLQGGGIDHALDRFFGSDAWRKAAHHSDQSARFRALVEALKRELKSGRAQHVVHFDVNKSQRKKAYTLVHATNSLIGCDAMKRAMWKADEKGDFKYVAGDNLQPVMIDATVDHAEFGEEILAKFGDGKWHDSKTVRDFAKSDATRFHEGHVVKTIAHLEKSGRVRIERSGRSGFKEGDARLQVITS